MVEGIPVFFVASVYSAVQLAIMAVVFTASTIITYVVPCIYSAAGLQRVRLGSVERYGRSDLRYLHRLGRGRILAMAGYLIGSFTPVPELAIAPS